MPLAHTAADALALSTANAAVLVAQFVDPWTDSADEHITAAIAMGKTEIRWTHAPDAPVAAVVAFEAGLTDAPNDYTISEVDDSDPQIGTPGGTIVISWAAP